MSTVDAFDYIALPKNCVPAAPMMTAKGMWVVVLYAQTALTEAKGK